MTRSQTTPASSQIITLERMLREAEAERDRLRAELEQIARVANCGSVDSWLALPDEHKRKWFALLADESSRKAKAIREADALRADVRELVGGLAVMTERYTSLVNSGDAGNWDPEEELEVRVSRALLAKHRDPLQALADNSRELGLTYDGSKT